MCVCPGSLCLSLLLVFPHGHVLKTRQFINLLKFQNLFREKPFAINFLATSCCYIWKLLWDKSTCMGSTRRGSFCSSANVCCCVVTVHVCRMYLFVLSMTVDVLRYDLPVWTFHMKKIKASIRTCVRVCPGPLCLSLCFPTFMLWRLSIFSMC